MRAILFPVARSGAGPRTPIGLRLAGYAVMVFAMVASMLPSVSWAGPSRVRYDPPGRTERISLTDGSEQANGVSSRMDMSGDGRYVAFESGASNLVEGDANGTFDVFVRDLVLDRTELISRTPEGLSGNGISYRPAISADGRFVAFASRATNLVPDDPNILVDVFLFDRHTKTMERISSTSDGEPVGSWAWGSDLPSISADGRLIAFESDAANIAPGYQNKSRNIFVFDAATSTIEPVSLSIDGSLTSGWSSDPVISADGRTVAFQSNMTDLVEGNSADLLGSEYEPFQIYVRELVDRTTHRVSISDEGIEGNGSSWEPGLSEDGTIVSFRSTASNLVPADANRNWDIFVHDRSNGTTDRVSVTSDGAEANGLSAEPEITADGRVVVFESTASNLVPGDTNGARDIFAHDRHTGITERVSVTSSGQQAADMSGFGKDISADGRYVAFHSWASNLVLGDTNGADETFLRDRGPAVGIGEMVVSQGVSTVDVRGWSRIGGGVLAEAVDETGDAGAAGSDLGTDLENASITLRPEESDLQFVLGVTSLPGLEPPAAKGMDSVQPGATVPGAAGAGGVVYGLRFALDTTSYELRAARVEPRGASVAAAFRLFRCDGTCTEVGVTKGGYGTAGNEIRISIPLGLLDPQPGAKLTAASAFAGLGTLQEGLIEEMDSVGLPDTELAEPSTSIHLIPDSAPDGDPGIRSADVEIQNGRFSASLGLSSVPAGIYRLRMATCLAGSCGESVDRVTIGGGSLRGTNLALGESAELSVQYSDAVRIDVRLSSSEGTPLEAAPVTFEIVGSSSALEISTTTDAAGIASIRPVILEAPGSYDLVVSFEGDDTYAPSLLTAPFVVTAEDTALELSVTGNGAKRRLIAELSDMDTPSDTIANRAIAFYSDGEFLGEATTDHLGVATFDPAGRDQGGPRFYEARFAGDDHYLSSGDGVRG